MGSITTRKLNDFDAAIYIHSNKMTGYATRFAMSNELVCLKCTWTAIVDIIHSSVEPVHNTHQDDPEYQHTKHSYTKIEQWMGIPPHCTFRLGQAMCCILFSCWSF